MLVTETGTKPVKTSRCEVDSRTALTRGLADYLAQLTFDGPSGRHHWLRKVYSEWPDPENVAEYPSAIVFSDAIGTYDASRLSPGMNKDDVVSPSTYLLQTTELILPITIDCWATDVVQRRELAMAIEAAMVPVSWKYGVTLELPYYYGVRATFEMQSSRYMDSDVDAVRRYRRVIFSVRGCVPVVRAISAPMARPAVRVDEVGPDVLLDNAIS